MSRKTTLMNVVPVLPSANIKNDLAWHLKFTGFKPYLKDKMYACLKLEDIEIHLQWHADTSDDPLLGGSVVKLFVENIECIFADLVGRGTVGANDLRRNTPWGTTEFGFYDLNKNAFFFVENVKG